MGCNILAFYKLPFPSWRCQVVEGGPDDYLRASHEVCLTKFKYIYISKKISPESCYVNIKSWLGCRVIRSTLMANLLDVLTVLWFMIETDLRTCSLHKVYGRYLPNQMQLLLFPELQWSFSNNIIITLHFWEKIIIYNNDWSHRNS